MKVLGIDPSSTLCGLALIEDFELRDTYTWKKDATKSGVWNLANYYRYLDALLPKTSPHMVCVEFLSVERNAQTTRKVSHFQAISALVPKLHGRMVIEGRVSSARKEALGRGNMAKDEAFEAVKQLYPNHKFLGPKSGGMDEADAVVLALAGPGLAEGK